LVKKINLSEYRKYVPELKHVYLTGDLKQPVLHPSIRDLRVEFILTSYVSRDHGLIHWHSEVTEYEVMIEGKMAYFDVATKNVLSIAPEISSSFSLGIVSDALSKKAVDPSRSKCLPWEKKFTVSNARGNVDTELKLLLSEGMRVNHTIFMWKMRGTSC
jgi:hypothetical protein